MIGNQVADHTLRSPRFLGAAQAVGGLSQCAVGGGLAATGVGFVPGMALSSHGIDNYVTGFNQCWTGKFQDSATAQLLEKIGMSKESASLADNAVGLALGQMTRIAGTKIAAGVSSQMGSSVRAAMQEGPILHSFKPQILEGNKNFGLKHIIKRHEYGSNAKKASKFLPGIGKKEISIFANDACRRITKWEIGENGLLEGTIDFGKIVGTKMKCGSPTSSMKVILDGDILHTIYPY